MCYYLRFPSVYLVFKIFRLVYLSYHRLAFAFTTPCSLGCFIFSPFSIFENPGVSVGGVLVKNSTPKILAHCDVIKMWLKTVEVSEARKSEILSYLKNRLS